MVKIWVRSVVVLGALVLAACGGGQDAGSFDSTTARIDERVALEVDGTFIYVSDVRELAESGGFIEPSEPLNVESEVYRELLDELHYRRLLALAARRRDLHESRDVQRRVERMREVILADALIQSVIANAVDEDAMLRLYEEQRSLSLAVDEARIRVIVLATLEEAQSVAELARAPGADFSQLAFQYSIDEETRAEGGYGGYIAQGDMVLAGIVEAAFSIPIGGVSDPFEVRRLSDDLSQELSVWMVLKVEDVRERQPPTFEELRPDLLVQLQNEAVRELDDDIGWTRRE